MGVSILNPGAPPSRLTPPPPSAYFSLNCGCEGVGALVAIHVPLLVLGSDGHSHDWAATLSNYVVKTLRLIPQREISVINKLGSGPRIMVRPCLPCLLMYSVHLAEYARAGPEFSQ